MLGLRCVYLCDTSGSTGNVPAVLVGNMGAPVNIKSYKDDARGRSVGESEDDDDEEDEKYIFIRDNPLAAGSQDFRHTV